MASTTEPGDSHNIKLSYDVAPSDMQCQPLELLHMPNELLDAVVALLDPASLCAFALTCKATRLSALEALYTTYTNRDAPSKAPFHLFLRTLCENAELASMVKVLDIRGWRSEFEAATGLAWSGVTEAREDKTHPSRTGPVFVSTSKTSSMKPKVLKLFENTAVKIGLVAKGDDPSITPLKKTVVVGSMLKNDEDFLRLLRQGVEDPQVVLILALLPSLMKLHVDGMSIYPTLDWYHYLRKSDKALRALREIKIRGQLSSRGSELHTTTMDFLSLVPNLERLNLVQINFENPRPMQNLMSSKRLKVFIAMDCRVDSQMLRTMLSGQKLAEFCYKPALRGITRTEGETFAEDCVVDCLKDSHHCLQKFTLYSIRPSKSPKLALFDRLNFLEMPFQPGFLEYSQQGIASILCKRISKSLSVLKFRYVIPSDDVSQTLKVLARLKHQGEFPKLKTVQVNFCRYSRDPWFPPIPHKSFVPEAIKMFGKMLGEAGIELELAQTD